MRSHTKDGSRRLGKPDFPLSEALEILDNSDSTEFRKEAAASIGRKHDPELVPVLWRYLEDNNPAVVCKS